MYNIISKIIHYIIDFVANILHYVMSLPAHIKGFIRGYELFIYEQKIKLKNIPETNIELGKHYLYQGLIKDAIFRLRITKLLFAGDNREIDYWLGWCYFMKSDYTTALSYLDDAKEIDKEGLGNFIRNCNNVDKVPEAIWHEIRRIDITEKVDRHHIRDLYNKSTNLPVEFTEFMLDNVGEFPNNAQIVDFGCGSGVIGSLLDYKVAAEYSIAGIEELDIFENYAKGLRGERGFVYDKVLVHSLSNMLPPKSKYDIVISFDSLSFVKNLEDHFRSFHSCLNKEGFFTIFLPLGNDIKWIPERKSFIYTSEYIEDQLRLAEFNIIAIKKWQFKAKNSYIAFVCNK